MRWILLFIFIFYIITYYQNNESFSNRQKRQDILENKSYLSKYSNAKKSMPWIDPVIYEDIYHLKNKNILNDKNIETFIKF
jgi:hypothetical protein